jgi:hypothetical protein
MPYTSITAQQLREFAALALLFASLYGWMLAT